MSTAEDLSRAREIRARIQASGVSVFDDTVDAGSPYFYEPDEIRALLLDQLLGIDDLAGLKNRTRGKLAKQLVAKALGYPVPEAFKRVRPRLRHAGLDVAAQGTSNFQPVNEDVDASRRYVFLVLGESGSVIDIRVLLGPAVADMDTTGTVTMKFQAARRSGNRDSRLVSIVDTQHFLEVLAPVADGGTARSPVLAPEPGSVLPIAEVYRRLHTLVGQTFRDPGANQERNRGAVIHTEACKALGCDGYADNGQFPDILSELVEIKLQLSPTVDLGIELPDAETPLASTDFMLNTCDVRYALFHGSLVGDSFTIDALVVSTGADFFNEYRQFGGLSSNKKLQIRLPACWWYQD